MRLLFRLAAVALLASPLAAQDVTVPARGTDATFDVATWNLEFFGDPMEGPNDDFQFRYVRAVVEQAGIDVWAFQEVSDGDDFGRLRDSLALAGFDAALGPNVSTPNSSFDQKLAFVWDTSVLTGVTTRTLFEGESGASFEFAGRLPFELTATATVGGEAREVRIIGFHAKANTSSASCDIACSYERRVDAAARLKAYADGLLAKDLPVVILGDFNDLLTGSVRGTTFASPYRPFVDDADYGAATLATEDAGLATFCGSDNDCGGSSTIDHVLYSAETLGFVPDAANPQRQRYGELLTALPQYTNTTSDHLPALANLVLTGPVDGASGPEAGPVALLPSAPSPFRSATRLRFRLAAPAAVALDVFDVTGRRVASVAGPYGAGEHAVTLDGSALAPGAYLVRLRAGGEVRSRLITRL